MQTTSCTYTNRGITTRIQAVGDGIIRITRTRRSAFLNGTGPAAVLSDPIPATLEERDSAALFTAGEVTVRADKTTGALSFLAAEDTLLLREPDRRPCLMTEKPVLLHRYDRDAKVTESASVDGARASAAAAEVYEDRIA